MLEPVPVPSPRQCLKTQTDQINVTKPLVKNKIIFYHKLTYKALCVIVTGTLLLVILLSLPSFVGTFPPFQQYILLHGIRITCIPLPSLSHWCSLRFVSFHSPLSTFKHTYTYTHAYTYRYTHTNPTSCRFNLFFPMEKYPLTGNNSPPFQSQFLPGNSPEKNPFSFLLYQSPKHPYSGNYRLIVSGYVFRWLMVGNIYLPHL